ncbi:hypothetical protein EII34_13345 [Arachnia propionica]|uniref:Uncharacterized protein n=1 Tax=Arachnia propionica TaxID=1750 RepID=A0A3P1T279_9ACTN|nr:hypothetical protein [Arachnia propionica]RRD03572.1 hypothetical protein EII34_13345 [Arachnia propionica]
MILVYRGWGGAGLGLPLLGAGVGLACASGLGVGTQWFTLVAGLGILLGGVGAYLLGMWLNTMGPRRRVAEFEASRRAQLQQLVDAGEFQVSPAAPDPSSRREGHDQVEALLAREVRDIRQATSNNHTLYGIPMQFFGLLGVVVGVVIVVAGVMGG